MSEPGGVAALRIDTSEALWRREAGALTLGAAYLAGRAWMEANDAPTLALPYSAMD